MIIKKILKKIIYGKKSNSSSYIKYLKKIGVKIGENCRIFNLKTVSIDTQNPRLLQIGDNVRITSGVIILTHDYSWSVLSVKYGEMFGNVGEVKIGNNVFIGMNSIILKNTTIGNNVIIGAGSIVSGKIDDDSVYCGNPAKKIMSIDEFYKKVKCRQKKDVENIKNCLNISSINKNNYEKELFEYFYIFKDYSSFNKHELMQIYNTGNYKEIIFKMKENSNVKKLKE